MFCLILVTSIVTLISGCEVPTISSVRACYLCLQKATKWSERRDAVAELTKLASTKRIAPGDFTEICRTLKKVMLFFYLHFVGLSVSILPEGKIILCIAILLSPVYLSYPD